MTPPIDKACLEPAFAGLSRIKPECMKKIDPKLAEAILKPRVREDGLSPLGKTVLSDVKRDVASSAPADLTSVDSVKKYKAKPVLKKEEEPVATDVPVDKPHKSKKPETPLKAKVRVYDETNIPAPKVEPKAAPVAETVVPKAPESTAPVAETPAETAPKPAPEVEPEATKFEISTGANQDVKPAKTTPAKTEPELADPFTHDLIPKHEASAATAEPKSPPAVRSGFESLAHAEPTNRKPVSTPAVETTAEIVSETPTPVVDKATTTPVAETPAETAPIAAPETEPEATKFETSTGPSQDVQPAKTTSAKAEPELADPFTHDLIPKHEAPAVTAEPKSAPAVRSGLESLAHAEPTNRAKAPVSTPAVETSAETVAEVPTPSVDKATTTPVAETPAEIAPIPAPEKEPEKPKFEISTGPSQDVMPAKTTPEKVEDYKGPFASDLTSKYEAPAADSKSLPSKVTLPAPFTKLARGEAAHLGGDPAKIAANNADAAGKAIGAASAKAQAEAQANIQGYKPNDAISGGSAQNSAAQSADKTPAPYTGPVYTSPATVTPDAQPAEKPPLDKTFMEGSMLNQTGKADEAPSLLDGVVPEGSNPNVSPEQMRQGTNAHDSSEDTAARDARIVADAKAAAAKVAAEAKAAKPAEPPAVAPSAPEVPPSSDSVPAPAEGAAPEAQPPATPAVKPEPEVDPKEAEVKAKYQAELDAAEERNRLQRKADDERIAAARKETERLRTEAQQKADSLAAAKAATPAPVEAPSAPLPKPVDPFKDDPNYLKRRGVRYAKMDIESDKNIYYNLDEPGKLTRIRDFGLFTWASDYMPKELETYEPSMKKADIKYNGGKN